MKRLQNLIALVLLVSFLNTLRAYPPVLSTCLHFFCTQFSCALWSKSKRSREAAGFCYSLLKDHEILCLIKQRWGSTLSERALVSTAFRSTRCRRRRRCRARLAQANDNHYRAKVFSLSLARFVFIQQ